MKLAFTFLCENPARQTALTTFFREYLRHPLDAFHDLEWIVFAGANQNVGFEHPRLSYVRDYPANDRQPARLLADHFKVAPHAKCLGAEGLLTIGFAPFRAPIPVFMGVNSLQHLSSDSGFGLVTRTYRRWVVAHGVCKAAMVITNSNFAASQLIAAHPACKGKLLVSHEGTQSEYTPVVQPGEVEGLQRELGIRPGYLLWVSNFYRYKQAPLFIEAYADLPREVRQALPVIMVGGDWHGGQAAVQEVIDRRGVGDTVRILGWIDFKWLPSLYRHASAYVLSSREETFGRTTTEALASGTPCLLHDIPIMREIAGDAALLVNFNDRTAVVAKLLDLHRDASLRERLRVAGLQRSTHFSFRKMAVERVSAVRDWIAQHRR